MKTKKEQYLDSIVKEKNLDDAVEIEINRKKLEEVMFDLIDGECNACGKKLKKGQYFCCEACEIDFRQLENQVKLWD